MVVAMPELLDSGDVVPVEVPGGVQLDLSLAVAAALAAAGSESGSNANGQWVRFENGVQLCWAHLTSLASVAINTANSGWGFRSSQQSAPLPAAFVAPVRTIVSPGINAVGYWAVPGGSSADDFTWHLLSGASVDSGSYNIMLFAIGRWK